MRSDAEGGDALHRAPECGQNSNTATAGIDAVSDRRNEADLLFLIRASGRQLYDAHGPTVPPEQRATHVTKAYADNSLSGYEFLRCIRTAEYKQHRDHCGLGSNSSGRQLPPVKLPGMSMPTGIYSTLERLHRASMIRAYLMQTASGHIARTMPYRLSDPSEKSSISFYLGIDVAPNFSQSCCLTSRGCCISLFMRRTIKS